MEKIIVDILSPTGGLHGGIENVIRLWTKNLNPDIFDLRVVHCTVGIKYLNGYEKAYCYDVGEDNEVTIEWIATCYLNFLTQFGAPHICVASGWPIVTKAAAYVRQETGRNFALLSWIHNRLEAYDRSDKGTVEELLYADVHMCISNRLKNQIIAANPNAQAFYIGNPVIAPVSGEIDNNTTDVRSMVFVGRLDVIKGIDVILEAMYRAKDRWTLKVIGDGDIEVAFYGWIKMLGLKKQVKYLGWKDNPWEECKDCDIFVMASSEEGFGLVAFEASSLGKTVISTRVNGIEDYIVDGENGYLFEPGDVQGLTDILDGISDGRFHLCNPEVCKASVEPYSVDNYFERVSNLLVQVYESL